MVFKEKTMNLSLLKCHLISKPPSNPATSLGSSFLSASLLMWFGQFPQIPFQPSFSSSYLSSLQWPFPVALQRPASPLPNCIHRQAKWRIPLNCSLFPIRHWTSEIKEKTTVFVFVCLLGLECTVWHRENKEKDASGALVNSSPLCYCLYLPSGISLTEGPLLA